jgi:hypothetical protein
MKRVDIVPILLQQLPFILCSDAVQKGVNMHIISISVFFYGHSSSSRGGGWVKEDPIVTIFKWYYRQLRQRISETPVENKLTYEEFVRNVFVSKGLEPPASTVQPLTTSYSQPGVTETPASSSQPGVQSLSSHPTQKSPHLPCKYLYIFVFDNLFLFIYFYLFQQYFSIISHALQTPYSSTALADLPTV